jgi:hypothetical protein
MTIFRLYSNVQAFIGAEEVFPDVHLAKATRYCLVVGCRVVITFDDALAGQLDALYRVTWRPIEGGIIRADIVRQRYDDSLKSLKPISDVEPGEVEPVSVPRADFWSMMASAFPPPPPNRPGIVPAYPPPPSLPAKFYGHLPFQTTTNGNEHFYRFEAWPQSRKITVGAGGSVASGTYASPATELPFVTTGFGAVARAALPSYFPAVFRYVFQPTANAPMRCGAVIPNYGQSGGGVEVMFPHGANNVGAIADPVLIPPL